MTLVDTTVWIDWLRGRDNPPVRALAELLAEGDAAICPVILQELLQGAASPTALRVLRARCGALPSLIPLAPDELHAQAGELYARARWAGVTPRSPHDCLIVTTAIAAAVTLLHDDRDFLALAKIEPRLRFARV